MKISKIMVIDDSKTIRKSVELYMKESGYEVILANDGFELSRNIRNTKEIADRPIVMVTSRTGQKHRDFSQKLGVNEHFGKPFDKNELLRSINRLVEGQDVGS